MTKFKSITLTIIVMALWGSIFPCVKLGYAALSIASTAVPDIIMFAGVRFVLCGGVVTAIALLKRDKLSIPKVKSFTAIVFIGLFSIVLHYICTYIGLSVTDGSKTAIIKQLGSLLYVCFAFLFIKSEKYSIYKILGAIIGFLGIVAINVSSVGVNFALGDFLIIGASICTVIAGILTKNIAGNNSPFWITGISQFVGGAILVILSLALGGKALIFNLEGTLIFTYICCASTVGYLLWNYVLKTSDLSNLFIIKFVEPLFACVFSAILLGEDFFKIQYLVAFVLISLGIVLGNKGEVKEK